MNATKRKQCEIDMFRIRSLNPYVEPRRLVWCKTCGETIIRADNQDSQCDSCLARGEGGHA